MSNDKSLEYDFNTVKAQVREKLAQALKLISEADILAAQDGTTIRGMDPSIADDLQVAVREVGIMDVYDEGWQSSQPCW